MEHPLHCPRPKALLLMLYASVPLSYGRSTVPYRTGPRLPPLHALQSMLPSSESRGIWHSTARDDTTRHDTTRNRPSYVQPVLQPRTSSAHRFSEPTSVGFGIGKGGRSLAHSRAPPKRSVVFALVVVVANTNTSIGIHVPAAAADHRRSVEMQGHRLRRFRRVSHRVHEAGGVGDAGGHAGSKKVPPYRIADIADIAVCVCVSIEDLRELAVQDR